MRNLQNLQSHLKIGFLEQSMSEKADKFMAVAYMTKQKKQESYFQGLLVFALSNSDGKEGRAKVNVYVVPGSTICIQANNHDELEYIKNLRYNKVLVNSTLGHTIKNTDILEFSKSIKLAQREVDGLKRKQDKANFAIEIQQALGMNLKLVQKSINYSIVDEINYENKLVLLSKAYDAISLLIYFLQNTGTEPKKSSLSSIQASAEISGSLLSIQGASVNKAEQKINNANLNKILDKAQDILSNNQNNLGLELDIKMDKALKDRVSIHVEQERNSPNEIIIKLKIKSS